MRLFVIVTILSSIIFAKSISTNDKIGQMLMVGFYGTSAPKDSKICQDIFQYNIGGVILFDFNPVNRNEAKNIFSSEQLKSLTAQLQQCSRDGKLLISVDQEGGTVQRLKSKYGFYGKYPRASKMKNFTNEEIKDLYLQMSQELKSVGVNYDLAPVVDLDINENNTVIHKLGRSFGKEPNEVANIANIFIDAMNQNGVLTSLKHFPGHGSSLGDTHKGFVDVSNLWNKVELKPYILLKDQADSIMVAHVFNNKLDNKYPASLSFNTINKLLREDIGYDGVVITDDLQMGAISSKYSLEDTLKLSINAGVDILLFGNQLNSKALVPNKTLMKTIKSLLESKDIDVNSINKAYKRVQKLKSKL